VATFKGKNDIKSVKRLAKERAIYNRDAFPEKPLNVVDFNFAERTLYGRIDREHNPVIPLEEFIVPLPIANSTDPSTTLLMNFVVDQFMDLELHFAKACRMGKIPIDDPVFSSLKAVRGYRDPSVMYQNYANTIMQSFILTFLKTRRKQVLSFNDFSMFFPQFMERMTQVFPVTFSGFQRSNQSSIFTSGLVVDVGGISFSNDETKQQLILDSPAFTYYTNLAKQYGFSLNKRNPGVLISDLASPATTSYRTKYKLQNTTRIFAQQFQKTLYQDLSQFILLMMNGYNYFVNTNPIYREFKMCKTNVFSSVHKRKYINIESININNIINIYTTVRNIEERYPLSQPRLKDVQRNAIRLRKVSELKMLEYIDDQFKQSYNTKRGSLTYYTKKLEKRLDK
tara:strand:- start:744 stop:1934 length:1191 start_codon:yes stop_codon:yes gene_type:complete